MSFHSVTRRVLGVVSAVVVLSMICGPVVSPTVLAAQTVDDQLTQLAEANADLYLEPIIGGLAGALAAPAFTTATPLGRFSFDFGVRMGFSFFPDGSGSFGAIVPGEEFIDGTSYPNPYQLRGGGTILTTPTVIGDGTPIVLEPTDGFREALLDAGMDPEDWVIRFPEGLVDLSALPTGFAQASMGLGFGSEVTLRFLPSVTPVEELGEISSYGFGVRHAISHWFPSTLDVSVLFGRQNVQVGDYLEGNTSQFGLMVGRPFGGFHLFGSALLRTVDFVVSYDTAGPHGGLRSTSFPVTMDSELTTSFGAGTDLGPVNVTGLYTRDTHSTLSIKVGFGVR